MIVRRNIPLYFISPQSKDLSKILNPSLPNTELATKGLEDKKILRVSLFASVGLGLMARRNISEGNILTVYQAFPESREDLQFPTASQSPFSPYTSEVWCLGPVSLKKVADIEVGEGKEIEKVAVGPRGTKFSLKKWEWKDLRPEWEQKKKPLK